MNNEIKEIINDLRKTADNSIFVVCSSQEELDKIPKYTANFLSVNDRQASILLDYITNLQEENKELKEDKSKMFETAVKRNNQLLDRIDNAIEYIGLNEQDIKNYDIYDVNGIEVYKILKGEDNE